MTLEAIKQVLANAKERERVARENIAEYQRLYREHRQEDRWARHYLHKWEEETRIWHLLQDILAPMVEGVDAPCEEVPA